MSLAPDPERGHPSLRLVAAWVSILVLGLFISVLLTGCGAVTTTVRVPVPVPCEVPDIPKPALPIDAVKPDADIFVIDRALWASLETLEGYVGQLRAAAEGCRSK